MSPFAKGTVVFSILVIMIGLLDLFAYLKAEYPARMNYRRFLWLGGFIAYYKTRIVKKKEG